MPESRNVNFRGCSVCIERFYLLIVTMAYSPMKSHSTDCVFFYACAVGMGQSRCGGLASYGIGTAADCAKMSSSYKEPVA